MSELKEAIEKRYGSFRDKDHDRPVGVTRTGDGRWHVSFGSFGFDVESRDGGYAVAPGKDIDAADVDPPYGTSGIEDPTDALIRGEIETIFLAKTCRDRAIKSVRDIEEVQAEKGAARSD